MLEQLTKAEVEKFREGAKFFRESADLYDKMGDLIENTELSDEKKEEEFEALMGKIIISYMKAQSLFS